MPTINFSTSFKINNDLLFSAEEFKNLFLFGIDSLDNNKNTMSNQDLELIISASQKEVEKFLCVKLYKQLFEENITFYGSDWQHWGYIPVTFPVIHPISLDGFINSIKQTSYPRNWLVVKKSSDDDFLNRHIHIVPISSTSSQTQSTLLIGIIPQLGYANMSKIPHYWAIKYVTGFNLIPMDIFNFIGQLSLINILPLISNISLGVPGIGSKSISLDGLSQSLSSGGYDKTLKHFVDNFVRVSKNLKDYYKGFMFTAI